MARVVNPLEPVPKELSKIEGIQKLRRQIQKEIDSPNVNEKSSNLPHLLSILKCIQVPATDSQTGSKLASAVLKPFPFSSGRSGRLVVDIVSSDGYSWYKVSARNPKALRLLVAGGGSFGQKSIVDHVYDYLECAKENPCVFKVPKVTVIFTCGISESVATEIEALGAFVQGERIPDQILFDHPKIKVFEDTANLKTFRDNILEDVSFDTNSDVFKNPSLAGVTKLNLDITAFFAYVSNLTNGHCDVNFPKPPLSDQAAAERIRPQKKILDEIFEGRQLICCETALKEFNSILGTVGGPQEKIRAQQLLQRITVVPDHLSDRVKTLDTSGNIKNRSLVIFGTGDSEEAVTVTANSGFVRSVKTQGIDLPAFIHESRALTEQKESKLLSS